MVRLFDISFSKEYGCVAGGETECPDEVGFPSSFVTGLTTPNSPFPAILVLPIVFHYI